MLKALKKGSKRSAQWRGKGEEEAKKGFGEIHHLFISHALSFHRIQREEFAPWKQQHQQQRQRQKKGQAESFLFLFCSLLRIRNQKQPGVARRRKEEKSFDSFIEKIYNGNEKRRRKGKEKITIKVKLIAFTHKNKELSEVALSCDDVGGAEVADVWFAAWLDGKTFRRGKVRVARLTGSW
jgi:hypothetical protein